MPDAPPATAQSAPVQSAQVQFATFLAQNLSGALAENERLAA
jgi:hypothetical protein